MKIAGTYVHSRRPLELWAGFECTVNRVGERYVDQLELSRHAERIDDLELLAELGVRAVRYPVLWERTVRDDPERFDWSWADERLGRLRELGIRPIVGLVHHGSGPRFTDLSDPAFATGLASFAAAVAARYPWVDAYTPVNEPLTTARFSGLYGHWYPHGRDDRTFLEILLNECRATVLAMEAIRAVNPDAELVQTEDLGLTHSTPMLTYQADFENERRWLSFDLLCGRVGRGHLLRGYLARSGIDDARLAWFAERACPPTVLGINCYLSSERFIDERLESYPLESQGGNGRHAYADVLAARVCATGPVGAAALLEQAWERYGLALAVTEVHNGCTREEQLRWIGEVWDGAEEARAAGADVRAVTAWSFIGAYGWDTLVTGTSQRYEPGVYDLRAPRPRPTALVGMLRALGTGRHYEHPVLGAPGWWRRAERLWYPPVACATRPHGPRSRPRPVRGAAGARPLLITGATGTLGRAFARLCDLRGLPYELLTRQAMDIADPRSVDRALTSWRPWAVVNTAGYVRVDDAEREAERCRRENADGPAGLAEACARQGIGLVTFSSDLVFDGALGRPYVESDPVNPINVYGRTKAEAERRVVAANPAALIVRTSAFFGPWDAYNFVAIALRELAAGRPFVAMSDGVASPTYVPDLVHTSLDLLIDGERGVWHLANVGAVSWLDFARHAAALAGVPTDRLVGRPTAELGLAAPRPPTTPLASERGTLLPPLEDALERFVEERVPAAIG